MPSPCFSSGQLEAICRALGDATVGGRITGALKDAGIPEQVGESTKWKRLRDSAEAAQTKAGNPSCVLRLVEAVMAPVGFSKEPERFEPSRRALNKVLSLTGHEVGEDGRVKTVAAGRTLGEAEQRARALHNTLAERGVHPDVLEACRPELLQENYFYAVLEATKSLAEKGPATDWPRRRWCQALRPSLSARWGPAAAGIQPAR